ncbi:MAG: TlpA family protein disulfide reductase [Brevefilum sp.]
MNKNQFSRIAISLVILSLVWIALTPLLFGGAQADSPQTAPHRGFYAPTFTLGTPWGEVHSLEEHEGSPVLVFFWASWCSICKAAMPGLEAVYQAFAPQGFTILAINTTNQDSLTSAETYFKSQGYSYTMLLDRDGFVANQYRMRAVPTSVLIDPQGKITDVIIGSGISEGFLRARVGALLEEGME